MCVFTQRVESVADTRIFARASGAVEQTLVYGMTVGASVEVAMVLPLPVAPGCGDEAVRFLDLSKAPWFFAQVNELFVKPPPEIDGMVALAAPGAMPRQRLVVHEVGDFVASFVPTIGDFDRLDPRFRLPDALRKVSAVADMGFAVFQLKGFGGGSQTRSVHPMGLTFPRRDPSTIFFPTLHVHDGKVRWTARFDHQLYVQLATPPRGWRASYGNASRTVRWPASQFVDESAPVYRRTIRGRGWNRDVRVSVA